MARKLTRDEIREQFLKTLWANVDYWNEADRTPLTRDKLSGLAFSLLVLLDGNSGAMPGFMLAPSPHKSDKDFNKSRGENWYPETAYIKNDIGGGLHEIFHSLDPKKSHPTKRKAK